MSERKDFHVWFWEQPAKFATDHTKEEIQRFKAEFATTAHRHQRASNVALWCVAIGFVAGALAGRFGSPELGWAIGMAAVFCGGPACFLYAGSAFCPACQNSVNTGLDRFCPECGAAAIESGFWKDAKCRSCGKRLERKKAKAHTIKFCTHCGVPLNDDGIRA